MATPQAPTPSHFQRAAEIVENAPALLLTPERWMLYSLVLGLEPKRCLEIGTHRGGSALITVAALDAAGGGSLVCVDDNPCISAEHWETIKHRVTLIEGKSQTILPTLEGQFHLAFIDGDHTTAGVIQDLEMTIPLMAPGGYIVCHDGHNDPINQAIRSVLSRYPLIDCGILTTSIAWEPDRSAAWGGMHLLRVHS